MKKYAMYPISIWFLIYLGIFLLFSQLSTGKYIVGEDLGYFSIFMTTVLAISLPIILIYQLYISYTYYKQKYVDSFLSIFFHYSYFLFMFCILLFGLATLGYPKSSIYEYFSILFLIMYFVYLIQNFTYKFLFFYFPAFLAAISDLVLKYISSKSFIEIFSTSNEKFYQDNLYFIPLSFIVIQLCIELYFFIKVRKK